MKQRKINFLEFFIICILIQLLPVSVHSEQWLNSAYDGRNAGIVTPVQDQGNTNLCWAYSSIAVAESSLLKSKIVENTASKRSILSPTQVGYACQNRGSDPLGNTSGAKSDVDYRQSQGSNYYASSLFSQWCGPVDIGLADSCNGWENSKYRLAESIWINVSDLKNDEKSRHEVKKAIVKYGAVTFSYNNARETYYYNPSNETGSASNPHACVIIGWDDNIPSSKFSPGGATQNGGWLVKNSYNSLPYFYLSYDNSSSNIYAFSLKKREKYDNNYFYASDVADFGLGSLLKMRKVANVFEAKKGEIGKEETVSSVNVGVDGNNAEINVKVYTNLSDNSDPTSGNLAAAGHLAAEYPGYYTIELTDGAIVEKGSCFSVVAEIIGNNNAYFKLTQNTGQSFTNKGSGWSKALGAVRIKAHTKTLDKMLEFSDSELLLTSNENKTGVLILACYDNEKLTDMRVFQNSGNVNRFDIPSEWQKKSGRRLKAMLWETILDMNPICMEETDWN